MPACSLGVPNTQMICQKVIHKSNYCMPFPSHVVQAGSWVKTRMPAHMVVSQRPNKASTLSSLVTEIPSQRNVMGCLYDSITPVLQGNPNGIPLKKIYRKFLVQPKRLEHDEPVATVLEKGEGEKTRPRPVSQLIPNSNEVMSLLSDICDTTSIAEFELKLDGFHLHVTRALSAAIDSPSPPPVPSVSTSTSSNIYSKEPTSNDQVSSTSLAIIKTGPVGIKSRALLDRAADEGLVVIQSPKVGFFRRCRTIKGKRAPPACKEKQTVKEGQVICYIEQLGWEAPIESDVSGEVLKFLCEDGEPVGFGDPIIAILPSFPGIKKLPAES